MSIGVRDDRTTGLIVNEDWLDFLATREGTKNVIVTEDEHCALGNVHARKFTTQGEAV